MYYVPSLDKEVNFKNLTIGQLKKILKEYKNPNSKIKFNEYFILTLIENCSESISFTNFDKEILLLQIHLTEIKEKNILHKHIKHPTNQNICEGLYKIEIIVPTIKQELEFCKFIYNIKNISKNLLLLAEIAKHTNEIKINNTTVTNNNSTLHEKIKIIKQLTPPILANCIHKIDTFKQEIKNYFKLNNTVYKYDISLLLS